MLHELQPDIVLPWGASCIGATKYTILKFVLFQGDIVALKKLKMEREKEGFPITSLREINTLLKAQHPNIVTVRVSALLMPLWCVIFFSVSNVIVLLFFSNTLSRNYSFADCSPKQLSFFSSHNVPTQRNGCWQANYIPLLLFHQFTEVTNHLSANWERCLWQLKKTKISMAWQIKTS